MSLTTLDSRNRRSGSDRRRTGWPALVDSLRHRRRRTVRRPEDADGPGYYLDVLPRSIMVAVAVILTCCALDAIFTMRLLSRGAVEVNPFMRVLIEHHVASFVGVKFALTVLATSFLATHAHFRLLNLARGRHVLYASAAMYGTLIGYQLFLLQL